MLMSQDWEGLSEELAALVKPTSEDAPKPTVPTRSHAGVEWDGTSGVLSTGPMEEAPSCWDDLLRRWNLDPSEVEVIEPVGRRSWETQGPDGIVTLNYFKANLRTKHRSGSDLEELLAEIKRHRPSRRVHPAGTMAYVVCSGDLQAGKEGSAGMVGRFLKGLEDGPARLKELRKAGRDIGPIYLPWLGDCIEHVQGHYAMQTFTTELTLTEQIRLVRRLVIKQIETYAPLTRELIVPVVPGNHDEAVRSGNKAMTNFSDSFSTEIASTVHDMIAVNPKAYGHVKVYVPEPEEVTITLDVCGTVVGMAHGHTFGRDPMLWWARQAHGMQPVGDATVLLAGHLHHLHVKQDGAKAFIQIPALDSGSQWWKLRTGQDSPPGIVTLTVGAGGWGDLAVL